MKRKHLWSKLPMPMEISISDCGVLQLWGPLPWAKGLLALLALLKQIPGKTTTALPAADTPIACDRKTLSCCRRCWGDVLPLLGECCWRRVSRAALQSSCSCGMLARLVEAVPCAERGKCAKRAKCNSTVRLLQMCPETFRPLSGRPRNQSEQGRPYMYLDQNSSVSNCGEGAAMVNSGTDRGKHTQ